jgi:hypothetical protein
MLISRYKQNVERNSFRYRPNTRRWNCYVDKRWCFYNMIAAETNFKVWAMQLALATRKRSHLRYLSLYLTSHCELPKYPQKKWIIKCLLVVSNVNRVLSINILTLESHWMSGNISVTFAALSCNRMAKKVSGPVKMLAINLIYLCYYAMDRRHAIRHLFLHNPTL